MAWPFSSVVAPNKDSGFITVPTDAPTNPTNFDSVSTYWVMGCWFANDSDKDQSVLVTDGSAAVIVPHVNVPARGVLPLGPEFMPAVGVKWVTTGPGITGKIWGYS